MHFILIKRRKNRSYLYHRDQADVSCNNKNILGYKFNCLNVELKSTLNKLRDLFSLEAAAARSISS